MIDYIGLFILYLFLLNFKLTLSSIYIFQSDYMPVRYTATHSSFICSLSWFLHLIFFDLFVLLVSLEWPGHPNPSYSLPSKLPCICAPAYVYYEMLLYILMEYCTLVSITAWRELEMPHSPVPNNRHVYFEIST